MKFINSYINLLIYILITIHWALLEIYKILCLVGRVFAIGPGDLGSKTLKMVLYASLLNTQQYKVRIKSKVEQSKERISALPYTSVF